MFSVYFIFVYFPDHDNKILLKKKTYICFELFMS